MPSLAVGTGFGWRAVLIDEAKAKAKLRSAGLAVPCGVVASGAGAPAAASQLGFPVALKMVSAQLPHKTEAGAVRLGLASAGAVAEAVAKMREGVLAHDASAVTDAFLIERMVGPPIAEIMVSIRRDPQFGYAMTLASGGILVELLADATTLLLPATRHDFDRALSRLRINKLLGGYRGKPAADRGAVLDALGRLAEFAMTEANGIAEIEINPLFALADGTCAVDVLMQLSA